MNVQGVAVGPIQPQIGGVGRPQMPFPPPEPGAGGPVAQQAAHTHETTLPVLHITPDVPASASASPPPCVFKADTEPTAANTPADKYKAVTTMKKIKLFAPAVILGVVGVVFVAASLGLASTGIGAIPALLLLGGGIAALMGSAALAGVATSKLTEKQQRFHHQELVKERDSNPLYTELSSLREQKDKLEADIKALPFGNKAEKDQKEIELYNLNTKIESLANHPELKPTTDAIAFYESKFAGIDNLSKAKTAGKIGLANQEKDELKAEILNLKEEIKEIDQKLKNLVNSNSTELPDLAQASAAGKTKEFVALTKEKGAKLDKIKNKNEQIKKIDQHIAELEGRDPESPESPAPDAAPAQPSPAPGAAPTQSAPASSQTSGMTPAELKKEAKAMYDLIDSKIDRHINFNSPLHVEMHNFQTALDAYKDRGINGRYNNTEGKNCSIKDTFNNAGNLLHHLNDTKGDADKAEIQKLIEDLQNFARKATGSNVPSNANNPAPGAAPAPPPPPTPAAGQGQANKQLPPLPSRRNVPGQQAAPVRPAGTSPSFPNIQAAGSPDAAAIKKEIELKEEAKRLLEKFSANDHTAMSPRIGTTLKADLENINKALNAFIKDGTKATVEIEGTQKPVKDFFDDIVKKDLNYNEAEKPNAVRIFHTNLKDFFKDAYMS